MAVADPYRWLEDGGSPEDVAWSAEQERYLRASLDRWPGRRAIQRAPARALLHRHRWPPRAPARPLLLREAHGRPGAAGPLRARRTFAGPTVSSSIRALRRTDAAAALDWHYPSPDGRLLAYGLSEGGSEKSTLRVRDVESGALLPDTIPFTRACSLEWLPDASAFFYTRYPEPGTSNAGAENYDRRVFLHRLGSDWRDDALVFAPKAPEDWPNVHLSPDGRFLAISVSLGWTRTDVYLQDLASGGPLVTVVEGEDATFGVDLRNDRLFLHTNLGARRFRLLAVSPERPARENWREILPEGDDVLEGAGVVGTRLLALRLRDASSRLVLHDLEGAVLREIALPALGTVAGLTGRMGRRRGLLRLLVLHLPPRGLPRGPAGRRDASSGSEWRPTWTRRPSPPASSTTPLETARGCRCSSCTSKDRPSDGTGPAVLTGYGGFAVSHTPAFGRSLLLFLERGGLYAVAHLRGGGEYGEDWHRAGMLGRKQNVFDDFLAAAEFLVGEGHAAKDRLAIMGGSNGGLLVGAALTQRPDLFRAAVCQVPLLDMLRYHALPHRAAVDPRVRRPRGSRGVRLAPRLLALPPRGGRRRRIRRCSSPRASPTAASTPCTRAR